MPKHAQKKLREKRYRVYVDKEGRQFYLLGGRKVYLKEGQKAPMTYKQAHRKQQKQGRIRAAARPPTSRQDPGRDQWINQLLQEWQKVITERRENESKEIQKREQKNLEKIIAKQTFYKKKLEDLQEENAQKKEIDEAKKRLEDYERKHQKVFENIKKQEEFQQQLKKAVDERQLKISNLNIPAAENTSISSEYPAIINANPRIAFSEKNVSLHDIEEKQPEEQEQGEIRAPPPNPQTIEQIKQMQADASKTLILSQQKQEEEGINRRKKYVKKLPRGELLSKLKTFQQLSWASNPQDLQREYGLMKSKFQSLQERREALDKAEKIANEQEKKEIEIERRLMKRIETGEKSHRSSRKRAVAEQHKEASIPQHIQELLVVDLPKHPKEEQKLHEVEPHVQNAEEHEEGFGDKHDGTGITVREILRLVCVLVEDIEDYDIIFVDRNTQQIHPRKMNFIVIFLKQSHYTCLVFRHEYDELWYFDCLASKQRFEEDLPQIKRLALQISPQYQITIRSNVGRPLQDTGMYKDDQNDCGLYTIVFIYDVCQLDCTYNEAIYQDSEESRELMDRLRIEESDFIQV